MRRVEAAGRLAKVTRLVRSSLAELLDQSRPFGRLALVHSLQGAGSTLITISLAGSLFFSISPHAAEGKILLYLVLTIAPFALVGPALSPLLDRGRQARRVSVAVATSGSVLLCLGMARDIHSLLLFPEAFGVLVLSKLYLVAKSSLVPSMAASGDDFAIANAKLAVLASVSGFAAFPLGLAFLQAGPSWVLGLAAIVFVAGTVAALRLPRTGDTVTLASVPGEPTDAASSQRTGRGGLGLASLRELREARRREGRRLYPGEVLAAISAMSVARATVGFVEFFLAFGLRRAHAATWWYGVLLIATGAGSLLGSMLVPRLRRQLSEGHIIVAALLTMATGSIAAAIVGGLWAQALLTFVVGAGPTSAKPALDSIVQRHVPPALFGRAFGRMETRLQLLWVAVSLLAVVVPFPLPAGDLVVALGCGVAGISYASAQSAAGRRRTRRSRPSAGHSGRSVQTEAADPESW